MFQEALSTDLVRVRLIPEDLRSFRDQLEARENPVLNYLASFPFHLSSKKKNPPNKFISNNPVHHTTRIKKLKKTNPKKIQIKSVEN